jgi:hypothetical protein
VQLLRLQPGSVRARHNLAECEQRLTDPPPAPNLR